VLGRKPQVHHERGEVVGDARDRRGVAALPLRREVGRLAVGDGDGLLAGLGVADVEEGPEVRLIRRCWSPGGRVGRNDRDASR
jgi:hypothetical protein